MKSVRISIVTLAVLFFAASAAAQEGKSAQRVYDPEVEAVARTIFLELMSPW